MTWSDFMRWLRGRSAPKPPAPAPAPKPPAPAPTPVPTPVPSSSFGSPEHVTINGYTGSAEDVCVTADGILFDNMPSTPALIRIMYARRIDYKTFSYAGVVELGGDGIAPSIDAAGNIYFMSSRGGSQAIYTGKFVDGVVTNIVPVEGISKGLAGWSNQGAIPSGDGKLLVFMENSGERSSLVMASANPDGSWTRMSNSSWIMNGPNVGHDNNGRQKAPPYGGGLSSDGLELYYNGAPHIYVSQRKSITEPFGFARRLVDGSVRQVEGSCISSDGKHFYYHEIVSQTRAELRVISRG